jgi:hypothetical protein
MTIKKYRHNHQWANQEAGRNSSTTLVGAGGQSRIVPANALIIPKKNE